ncbi:MAG: phosphoenolpyruvate synthase [Chitinophagaceae bacterium]|nr:MAG: phosphoenolpyruvate synthase [Chitinophagaceae bacterium]
MNKYIVSLAELDRSQINRVGGKAAGLGELMRIKGVQVPEGFCVTTAAFDKMIEALPDARVLLNDLSKMNTVDVQAVSAISAKIRHAIESASFPLDIANEVSIALSSFGPSEAFAVRSSATAEDLPGASFAGQHDSYLNIVGSASILMHIQKCWASLFTERAITYRIINGFNHSKIALAVIVQQLVDAVVSGVLFTADPVTSNRKIVSIDATMGLGEALVSGLVNPDNYQVRGNNIVAKTISHKQLIVTPSAAGGTKHTDADPTMQTAATLSDEEVLTLAEKGREIEAAFGGPQDIEWCLANGNFYMLQSRPITTLYPVPESDDDAYRVYVSVGHNQMMTDAMRPLGLSVFKHTSKGAMREAGNRLFVDITAQLSSPQGRKQVIEMLGKSHPLIKDALLTIVNRHEAFQTTSQNDTNAAASLNTLEPPAVGGDVRKRVDELISQSEQLLRDLEECIESKSGEALIEFIITDLHERSKTMFDPKGMQVIMAGMNAATWINAQAQEWLDEKNVADVFSQSVSRNVTSEMGIALLDVADVIRPYPQVTDFLQRTSDENFLDKLGGFDGGPETREAIINFLDKYGMRCVGEIDITRPRWIEQPLTVVPMILNNIKNFSIGEGLRRFIEGQQAAMMKEQDLISRLLLLPDGKAKADEMKRVIMLHRDVIGYREYPKYSLVKRYFIYKKAILQEANRLRQRDVISNVEDVYYLTLEELRELCSTEKIDHDLVDRRRDAYEANKKRTPPRVITSEGEIVAGRYHHDNIPANAIVGLGVSSGQVEGRARIIFDIRDAVMEEGDILVTTYTDPSWTPLFLSIRALVTEVGGLMTHGAVVAREYGLPAVAGVEHATTLIRDGQRIRVNGSAGFIQVLD